MFFKMYMLVFILFLTLGTIVAITANNWFTVWLGLEINLMSMIPLMINKLKQSLSEASIKYFITQAMASVILILGSTVNLFNNTFINMEMMNVMITTSMLMKAGVAPFHFWFPQVIINMNWIQSLLLFTWQKIAPLVIISSSLNMMTTTSAMASAIVGAVSGFNQTNMKYILTFSSISHSGWMISACSVNIKLLVVYFTVYSFLITSMIYMILNKFNKINEINYMNATSLYKISWVTIILSLGGMPPLLGFISKMLVINKITLLLMFIPTSVLISSSLLSLYWYMRLIYSTLSISSTEIKFTNTMNKNVMPTMITLSTMINVATPFILFTLT